MTWEEMRSSMTTARNRADPTWGSSCAPCTETAHEYCTELWIFAKKNTLCSTTRALTDGHILMLSALTRVLQGSTLHRNNTRILLRIMGFCPEKHLV